MVRLATERDAWDLFLLNREFNGTVQTAPLEHIQESLKSNPQEFIVVAEEGEVLAGYICVQLKRSFCFEGCSAEITEVFVREPYRRRGHAHRMIRFAEEYFRQNYLLRKFELLTRKDNITAQSVYRSLGYGESVEMHMDKSV